MPGTLFISTTIPCVHAQPHIGRALGHVQRDAFVRHMRGRGRDGFFLSGSDGNSLQNVLSAPVLFQQVGA
jgi:methionyl-tRNA synthetase